MNFNTVCLSFKNNKLLKLNRNQLEKPYHFKKHDDKKFKFLKFISNKNTNNNDDNDDDDDDDDEFNEQQYSSQLESLLPLNSTNTYTNKFELSSKIVDTYKQQDQESMSKDLTLQMDIIAINNNNSSSIETHCHSTKSNENDLRNRGAWIKLIIVTILCTLFMIGEVVGGVLANSLAIQTDAAHMLADISGFLISIFSIYISKKRPTKRMSFGFYRTEVLGALASTLLIWILTGVLIYMAIERIIYKEYESIQANVMLVTASCGVLFNIIMAIVLHSNFIGLHGHAHGHSHGGHAHGHSHNESFSDTERIINTEPITDTDYNIISSTSNRQNDKKKNEENINLRAASIHVLGDFIQSIGVLVSALIIKFLPNYKIADPICTFLFSFLVILTTGPIIKDIFYVLMEAFPSQIDHDSVISSLSSIRGVKKIHNLHIWSLAMDKFLLSAHLVTEQDCDTQMILREASTLLRTKFNFEKTTLQIEYYDSIMDICNDCKLPNS